MYHCIKQCFDKHSVLWSVGEISQTIPAGMEAYFKEGRPPVAVEPNRLVYLSQFAKPAFDANPSEVMPLSQYGKPKPEVAAEPVKKKK